MSALEAAVQGEQLEPGRVLSFMPAGAEFARAGWSIMS
jgi:hypothetical protein